MQEAAQAVGRKMGQGPTCASMRREVSKALAQLYCVYPEAQPALLLSQSDSQANGDRDLFLHCAVNSVLFPFLKRTGKELNLENIRAHYYHMNLG